MYNDVITLRSYKKTEEIDKYGEAILEPVDRQIFAEVKSVGMKEFYQAQSLGFKPEIVFEIADYLDYNREAEVIYEDYVYKILRTYRKTTNALEITCYGGVHLEHAEVSH